MFTRDQTHWAHDVAATLNQRQWCWFKVATTYCAQCEGLFAIWNNHKYLSWLFPLREYLWYGSTTFLYFCSFGAPKGLNDHYVAIYLLSESAICLPCFRHTIWLNPCSWWSTWPWSLLWSVAARCPPWRRQPASRSVPVKPATYWRRPSVWRRCVEPWTGRGWAGSVRGTSSVIWWHGVHPPASYTEASHSKSNHRVGSPVKTKYFYNFIQCWTNVEDVRPTLYKCYTNDLCLLGKW